jgi:hypothetical protein
MSDPGKVIVAMSFFASLAYIVRLITLGAVSYRRHDVGASKGLVVDDDHMSRLEQAVDAIALEVERISEGQRFTTKLLADRVAADRLPVAPSAEPRQVTPH